MDFIYWIVLVPVVPALLFVFFTIACAIRNMFIPFGEDIVCPKCGHTVYCDFESIYASESDSTGRCDNCHTQVVRHCHLKGVNYRATKTFWLSPERPAK